MSTQPLLGSSFDTYTVVDPFLANMEGGSGTVYGTDPVPSAQLGMAMGGPQTSVAMTLPFGLGDPTDPNSPSGQALAPISDQNNPVMAALSNTLPKPEEYLVGILAIVLIGVGVWALVK